MAATPKPVRKEMKKRASQYRKYGEKHLLSGTKSDIKKEARHYAQHKAGKKLTGKAPGKKFLMG